MKAATGKKGRLHSGPKNYSNFSSEICKPEDTLYLPRPWYREVLSLITSLIKAGRWSHLPLQKPQLTGLMPFSRVTQVASSKAAFKPKTSQLQSQTLNL